MELTHNLLEEHKDSPRAVIVKLLENFDIITSRQLFAVWTKKVNIDLDTAVAIFSEELSKHEERKKHGPTKPEALMAVDVLNLQLPPTEWILSRLIPKGGLVAISGVPGSYKSFFALWLGLQAANGLPLFTDTSEPFFCDQNTLKTPTMFIEEENSMIMTRERLQGMRGAETTNLHFRVDQGFKLQEKAWREALLRDVEARGIGLVIMDPFSSVMGLENENDNAKVSEAMDLLRKEFVVRGITIVFIHHPSKGSEDGDNLRGAGDILGKCDVHLNLVKDPVDKKLITVKYKKMRLISEDEVKDFKMCLAGDPVLRDRSFRYLGEAKPEFEVAREKTREEILKFMQEGLEYTRTEIASGIGSRSNNDKFDVSWKALIEEGKIYQPAGNRKFLKRG